MESPETPIPRLDFLLYGHDGRGLGHISRTAAIGMALRRLQPGLKILLVSGSAFTRDLVQGSGLDWIKLPAYQTVVCNGASQGMDGPSGYRDRELGLVRARILEDLIRRFRPRLVLADHQPQGKHRELVPALQASARTKTSWALGVRGIVGRVPQAVSPLGRQLFQDHYQGLLWYGDENILGREQQQGLEQQYQYPVLTCGYVSRLRELLALGSVPDKSRKPLAGTISLPWHGETGRTVLAAIVQALEKLGPDAGDWSLYSDLDHPEFAPLRGALERVPFCRVRRPGPEYIQDLLRSSCALIFGGYNSLTDVLAAGIPAVVLLRAMQDREQQEHLRLLKEHAEGQLLCMEEKKLCPQTLFSALEDRLRHPRRSSPINLDGAENAARSLLLQAGIPSAQ